MKRLFPFLILFIVLLSCSKENTTDLVIKISDSELKELVVVNEVDMFYDTISLPMSTTYKLALKKSPSVFLVQSGRIFHYIYAEAGGQVTISKSPGEQDLAIGGTHAKEQELLAAFSKAMDIATSKYSLMEIANAPEADFLTSLEERYQQPRALLNEKKAEGVDSQLISLLDSRIKADYYAAIVNYPQYYQYLKKEPVQLSNDYYDEIDHFDFNNAGSFSFNDVINAAQTVAGRSFSFEDYEDIADYYGDQYRNIDNLSSNPQVAELLKYRLLNAKINYSGGTAGMEEEIIEFIAESQDPVRQNTMRAEIQRWEHLQVGKPAPEFTAFTRDGEEVKLSDLRGKNIYIDVWATWCGPCIAEIPSLKAMEEKYSNENVQFVSVSIDKEEDREKWRQFVLSRELGGIQVMANSAWSSELTKKYNISGIPRFIMINDEGAIVEVDAPRPSNASAFNKMMETVLN
jgi:thiol-disulfide isomerase/thioredoxin